MNLPLDGIVTLLPDYLQRQRWYGAADRELAGVDVVDHDVLRDGWPLLVWLLVRARFADGDEALFQVPVGLRPLEATERFLEGKSRSFLGDVDYDGGCALAYDALVDPELSLMLLALAAPDEHADHVRALALEQSNTSVVFDERMILKLFRRIHDGPNPDVEVTDALGRVGFKHISAPVGRWQRDGRDLIVVREFLSGAVDGWQLALTSLRDLYDSRLDPSSAGGDFAPEAHRLGQITGEMHLALAEAFGTFPGDPEAWAGAMATHLERVPHAGIEVGAVRAVYHRLADVDGAGCSIRIHGDLHLGQTLRADTGWYILDFEGEPVVPLDERTVPSSPLRDVAGMIRSFHYAAEVGLVERGEEDDELRALARGWEERNASALLTGYYAVDGIDALLPKSDDDRRVVLDAFTLSKAVYEIGYELAHRPDWASIPAGAVARLLEAAR